MAIDVEKLAKDMFSAAFVVMKARAPKIKVIAEGEFKKIAQTLLTIEAELAAGQISREEATLLVEMQKSATRSVLLMSEGMSLIVAEQAINSALDVARAAVNTATGVKLL
jgi:hypothetical protein